MMKQHVHIAVVVSTINEEYQNGILCGIRQFSSANGITLSHFVAYGNTGEDAGHDAGEYNIFSLADFQQFDGIILLINTIQNLRYREAVLNRVRALDVPAVCIDRDVPELYAICIDNEKAMCDIMEHFILHHGFTKINFVSGPADNIDSSQRLKAYRETLEKYGISVEEKRIWHGNFVFRDGADAVQKFLQDELPQAIVCANDNMAIGVMNALSVRGIRVPEEIAVSGFDFTYNARNYAPSLTSVERPLEHVGQLACRKILNCMEGIPQKRSEMMETQCRFSQSCGCTETPLMNTDEFKKRNFTVLESFAEDVSFISRMASALTECDSLEKYAENLKPFIKEIHCKEFWLCLCDSWTQGIMANESEENYLMHILSPEHYLIEGYGDRILVPLAYRNGAFFECGSFSASEMLPELFSDENERGEYYFMPLHIGERTLGYCAVKDSEFPIKSRLFHNFITNLSNSLESVRKILCLNRVTQKLNKLYTVDTLANINNRNGFRIRTQPLFQECVKQHRPVMLMFLDMDGLKYINDTFGHKAGDNAIWCMAEVLRQACTEQEICCRFGGDEFIIFAADYTIQKAEALSEKIRNLLEQTNQRKKFSYVLSASLGYHISIPEQDTNLFQLVTIADRIMYEEKKRHKNSRYLKQGAVLPDTE
ncbi:MAG: GGDEF domain-containing protein [Oscillospiraceae bacterium]|nr:GGDEF domain-containing protein [Oscillospiraceae bacterium]